MRVRTLLQSIGLVSDRGAWLEEGRVLACRYPRGEPAVADLARRGISVLVNLHERGHDPSRLARHRLVEVHIPVKDFSAPSPEQIARGIAATVQSVAAGERVAVHCGGGWAEPARYSPATSSTRAGKPSRPSTAFGPRGPVRWRPPARWQS